MTDGVRLYVDLVVLDFVVTTFVPLDGTVPVPFIGVGTVVVLLLSFCGIQPGVLWFGCFVEDRFVFHSSHAWGLSRGSESSMIVASLVFLERTKTDLFPFSMLVLDSIGLLESKMPRKGVGRFVVSTNRIGRRTVRDGTSISSTNMLVRIERSGATMMRITPRATLGGGEHHASWTRGHEIESLLAHA